MSRIRLFKNNRSMRVALLVLVALGAAGVGVLAYATSALRTQDLNTIDTRFSIRGTQRPGKVVIVGVDNQTLRQLYRYQWPYPRAVEARVISNIAAQHPAAIEVDIQFNGQSPGTPAASQADELALLTAIQNTHGRTVFSFTTPPTGGQVSFLGSGQGTTLLHEVGSRPAQGEFPLDPGQVVRRMSYAIDGLPTLAVATAEVATHRRVSPADFNHGSAWIDFAGAAGTYPLTSFSTVYQNHVPPNYFRGKIVVLGATAPVILDIHPTSTDTAMSGPEVQANAIETILRGFPLGPVPGWVNIALIVLLAAIVPAVSLRLGPLAATLMALLLGAAFAVGVQLAFNAGWIVSVMYPLGGTR
jgi:CHASE2 domain-containing sensor protein